MNASDEESLKNGSKKCQCRYESAVALGVLHCVQNDIVQHDIDRHKNPLIYTIFHESKNKTLTPAPLPVGEGRGPLYFGEIE